MRPQLRIYGRPAFRAGQLPYPSDLDMNDRLRREVERSLRRSINITTTESGDARWVTMEVPNGTITVDRTKFTPIQEAYYRASQHMKRGDWPSAVTALREVIGLKPEPPLDAGVYTMLGIALFRTGDLDAAAGAFHEAIKIDEHAEFAHLFLGTALMLSDRFEEAIDPLKRTLELDPSQTHVNFYLGHVYSKLGRWDEAIAAYAAEIETHPRSPQAYQDLARLYVRLGDENPDERERHYLKAIETYRKWTEVSPGDSATYNFIGYLYGELGQLGPAIEAYEKAVEADRGNVIALSNLGTAYLATDRDSEAKEIFERLTRPGALAMREQLSKISSDPDEAVRLSMAEAYQKLGAASLKMYQAQAAADGRDRSLLAEAEAAFKAALGYLPNDIHSLYNLGVTYYMMGRRAAAIRQFRKFLEMDPNNEDAANNLRVVEEEQERVRRWLGSRVWRRLEGATEQTPVYSGDVADEIAEALGRIYEGAEAADEADVFTADDLLQALLPLTEYIPLPEARADLAARIVQRGWLDPGRASQLAGVDFITFLAHLYLNGVPILDVLEENKRADPERAEDYTAAAVETLKRVLELKPEDGRTREQLQRVMERRLDERLRASGLLKEIRGPITDFTPYRDRTFMTARSRPLSEIVIEGRR